MDAVSRVHVHDLYLLVLYVGPFQLLLVATEQVWTDLFVLSSQLCVKVLVVSTLWGGKFLFVEGGSVADKAIEVEIWQAFRVGLDFCHTLLDVDGGTTRV